ncbi:hypothetical protein MDAP_001808 [Mitosporidium daphniae]|uniref:RRM Nup35-type domain-containing protein n=1 Tax=Mitosporidium daphniae TaxID=1485682 RepID=A0A098VTV6_9MICR|nr:uncharacterized protein DI09_42p40 [Mitosporidium daphniae]KGG51161.1 hypothetical protein DI09_42p40 [Mitosporidium daphniae]|eukprot:XP_013237613.1 uncharacterized protein DI09_42p40 [Mitosporidium daphniae]
MSQTHTSSATYEWGTQPTASGRQFSSENSEASSSSSAVKSPCTSMYLPQYLLGQASSPDPLRNLPLTSSPSKGTPPSFFHAGKNNVSANQVHLERRTFSPLRDTISIDNLNQIIASSSSSSFADAVPSSGLLGSPPRESLSDSVAHTPCTPTPSSGGVENAMLAQSPITPFSSIRNREFPICTMTTIFGFPPAELDVIISYFKTIGTVKFIKSLNPIEPKSSSTFRDPFDNCSAGPSWIHVEWASPLDASKALEKQGTLMFATLADGTDVQYMLGVIPFDTARAKLNSICAEDVIWSCSPVKLKRQNTPSSSIQNTENIFLDYKQNHADEALFPLRVEQTQELGSYFDNLLNWFFGV